MTLVMHILIGVILVGAIYIIARGKTSFTRESQGCVVRTSA